MRQRPLRRVLLYTWVALGLTACAASDLERRDAIVLRIVDYGLYHPQRGVPVPSEQTTRIPAEVGTRFGFRFRAPFVTLANYRFVTRLPPMVNPQTGDVTTERVETLLVTNEINYFVGMTIEEPWQAVPGEWQMQILRGDAVLAEQTFQLYRP